MTLPVATQSTLLKTRDLNSARVFCWILIGHEGHLMCCFWGKLCNESFGKVSFKLLDVIQPFIDIFVVLFMQFLHGTMVDKRRKKFAIFKLPEISVEPLQCIQFEIAPCYSTFVLSIWCNFLHGGYGAMYALNNQYRSNVQGTQHRPLQNFSNFTKKSQQITKKSKISHLFSKLVHIL